MADFDQWIHDGGTRSGLNSCVEDVSKNELLPRRCTCAAEQQGASGQMNPVYADARRAEGWGEYLTRSLNERTEKLNLTGESLENAADASQRWADDASKWVRQQKRNMLLGGLKSKFM